MNESGRRALKTATHVLTRDLGSLEAAAAATRVKSTVLCDYGRHCQPHFAPVDVILDLELALGRPVVTQHLALAQGYDLVPIAASAGGLVPEALARLGRDMAALFGEAAAALANGRLTDDERHAVTHRGAQARLALAQLLSALEGSAR